VADTYTQAGERAWRHLPWSPSRGQWGLIQQAEIPATLGCLKDERTNMGRSERPNRQPFCRQTTDPASQSIGY
jgi:hypothetical protein